MIRILHVIGSLENGGSQSMVMNIYRKIDRTKIQFDFVVNRDSELFFANEIEDLGGKIFMMPRFDIKNITKYISEWINFFEKHPEYKVIHGHVRSTASIYLSIAKKYGLKTIAHSHSTSSGRGLQSFIKNILQLPLRYISDYLFACSLDAGIWLFGNRACKKENFHLIKNAIDVDKYTFDLEKRNKMRTELCIDDKLVIGHIGRFSAPKNHTFLIDVFHKLHERNKNTLLMLVGDGELRKTIEKKVNHLNIQDHVIFTGIRTDIPDLLQAMDVFVFPSLYEGLGIVLIEAQASCLPCIVSDAIPKEAFVLNNIHTVSLKSSSEKWAEIIQNQLNLLHENSRYNTSKLIKKSGYEIVESTSWLENFYLEICDNNVG